MKKHRYGLHCIVGLGIMFSGSSLPVIDPITPLGMQVLMIFVGLIYMWSTVGTLWSSLFGILALGTTDYINIKGAIAGSLGDSTAIMVLFAIILFGAIQHSGIAEYIARWFLTRKIINGRPMVFTFIFIFGTYVLGAMNASVLPAILLMWSILYSILKEVGYKKGDKYTTIMVIGTVFGAIVGQPAKPFTGAASMVVGSYEKASGITVDYLAYMTFGVIMAIISIALFTLVVKFLFKPDVSKIANINIEQFNKEPLPPMNKEQKVFGSVLVGYLMMVLLPSILPSHWMGVSLLNKLQPTGITVAFVAALAMIRIKDKPLLAFKEIVAKYVAWDLYFLVSVAMLISSALTADSTGIKPFLLKVLEPFLGGKSPFVFTVILVIFAIAITNVANNAVMGSILMPIIYAFSLQNGSNSTAVAMTVHFALFIAILTPAASPYAAVLHGNKEWVTSKEIYKYSSIILLMNMLVYIFIGYPIANIFFN